jgi:hypothetical protein
MKTNIGYIITEGFCNNILRKFDDDLMVMDKQCSGVNISSESYLINEFDDYEMWFTPYHFDYVKDKFKNCRLHKAIFVDDDCYDPNLSTNYFFSRLRSTKVQYSN